ncbi:hypothetical protein EYF80_041617 [Liparis tanakae]|uniref:Uncharacterized protein n=1 Tax=Liparis tanakae TaxID=230148 RepID=A0A4Z2G534_9TELE|nr:hypothetical protein EYF80_041617 [Liparis tanakae]
MESVDLATGRVIMATLFSAASHSWMVTILRPGAGMWRCVSRAFFRWWKSPSSAASLKETRRPMVPVERKRSVSWWWELAIDSRSASSTLMIQVYLTARAAAAARETERPEGRRVNTGVTTEHLAAAEGEEEDADEDHGPHQEEGEDHQEEHVAIPLLLGHERDLLGGQKRWLETDVLFPRGPVQGLHMERRPPDGSGSWSLYGRESPVGSEGKGSGFDGERGR